MLSPLWQRIGIAVGVGLGGLCWLGVLPSVQNGTGTGGVVLLDAHSVGAAVLLVIVAGVPALVLATLLSTIGRFTAGVAVLAGSLLVMAYVGGPTMGWIQRVSLPSAYWQLIAEMLLWQIMLLLAIGLMYRFRPVFHSKIPALLRPEPSWKTDSGFAGVQLCAGGRCGADLDAQYQSHCDFYEPDLGRHLFLSAGHHAVWRSIGCNACLVFRQ
jgi:hypothetical protein